MTNRDGSDITMSNIKTKIKESLGLPQSLSPETMFPSPKFEALTKIMSGLLRRSQTHPESHKTAFRKTATPESGYSQPGVPASTYSQPVAPVSGYSQPAIPSSGYSQPAVPVSTYSQQPPASPYTKQPAPLYVYNPPAAPVSGYSQPVDNGYSQPAAQANGYSQPAAPASGYSVTTVPKQLAPVPTYLPIYDNIQFSPGFQILLQYVVAIIGMAVILAI